MDILTQSIIGEGLTSGIFLLSTLCTLVFGMVIALLYVLQNKRSKTMAVALVIMPAIVQAIIMLVSGNIGAGIAVAGAFNLVRFRSAPGNAKDIGYIFFAMVIGFIAGMGFLLFSAIFLVLIGATLFIAVSLVMEKGETRALRIVLPENLDFNGLFDDVFTKYAKNVNLTKVRTTNMGSLYELSYTLQLNDANEVKAFIDEIRCRNGNLNVLLSQRSDDTDDL
ncbi:MAG: DUF4956 domain-containing protein [Defluviitaleaceae bacterium]|nr:DUF4956 domain-containing protein [Defluviitaleaceae bacterium]